MFENFLEVYILKKSTRILAFLMAFAMLIGSFSVMGFAYEAYKGDAIKGSYNDIDTPVFTTEQAASMALDEVDRMLAKEQIYLNVYVGELDLRSITYTVTSIDNLLSKASSLLGLLGSAADLTIASLKPNGKPMARNLPTPPGLEDSKITKVSDVEIITNLLDFLGDNAGIFEQYVNGNFSLGILNGFVADFIFDARELVIGLGYSLTEAGAEFDFLEGDFSQIPEEYRDPNTGAITLIQSILNTLVLGEWVKLDEYFDEPWMTVNTRYNYYEFADKYGETEPNTAEFDYYGYKHPDEWVLIGLGGAVRVPEGAEAPDPVYDALNVKGNIDGYTFVETLLQRAFNYILVPILNNQTRHALREWCGVVYDEKYTQRTIFDEATNTWVENEFYNPLYSGETDVPTEENATVYNTIFNVNAKMDKVTVPTGTTLISNINDIFGKFLGATPDGTGTSTGILLSDAYVGYVDENTTKGTVGDWTWQFGSNSYLFTNVANVAKYILQITGRMLFADYVEVPSAEVIEGYNDQQVVAFILRSIFNGSVDWMFVPNDAENQTILGVAYSAVEQLAYQDIPQFTYERPMIADYTGNIQGYYDALIEQALNILLDVAVYNLNQSFDANPEDGDKAGEGLIPYTQEIKDGSWEDIAVMVAKWAVNEYGPLLAPYKNLHSGGKNTADLTMDNIWTDIDTILNSLIPIVGSSAWINGEISGKKFANGDSAVAKNFVFEYLLKPIYTLDATNFSKIFDKNTSADAAFGTKNGVQIIANILDNVFDLLFPNVFSNEADTVDKVLTNSTLAAMIHDLLKSLGTKEFDGKANAVKIQGRGNDIAKVAIPVVDMLIGLSDEQEFEEMEIYLPDVIKVGEATTFGVYNGSSGINTAYTDANGNFAQDTLYEYAVTSVTAKAYHVDGTESNLSYSGINNTSKFSGGDSVNVVLAADGIVAGDIIEFTVNYTVSGEEPDTTIGGTLAKTVYAYAGESAKGDDELDKEIPLADGRVILYTSDIYLDQGDDLDDIESYGIRIQDNEAQIDWVDPNKDENGNPISTIAPTLATATLGTVTNASTAYPFVGTSTEGNTAALTGQDGIYFLNPFKLAEKEEGVLFERYAINYQIDEETGEVKVDEETGEPIPDGTNNGGVIDGDYKVTVPVTVGSETKNVEITIHLYDDFDLPGAFNSAVAKNRQQAEYASTTANIAILYSNYTDAVKNAAILALTPKSGANFMEFIGMNDTSDEFVNYYEQRALELETAIEALEEWKVAAGVDNIKNIIKGLDGYNYEDRTFQATVDGTQYTFHYQVPIEYYEEGYVFFGERNYVPYLYSRYRDARGNGQGLVNSQEIFVKAPFNDADVYGADYEPSEEEIMEYTESLAAAVARMKNPVIVGSTEAAYAEHMLRLTSKRLVKLEASKIKLDAMIDTCSVDLAGNEIDLATGASKYTTESWEAYSNAITFANKVNAKPTSDAFGAIDDTCTNPVEVNVAMSELVNAWKKLIESNNFAELDQEIADSVDYLAKEADYTPESFAEFKAAYDAAVAYDRETLKSDEAQDEIDALALALKEAREGLKDAAAAEPTYSIVTSTPAGMESYFQDKSKKNTFVPTIMSSTSNKHQASFFVSPLAEDKVTVVDDFIIGVGANLNATAAAKIFEQASLNNCYVKYTANSKNKYSTGALLQICKSSDDSVIKTFQIIHYGEVVPDGRINNTDVTNAKTAIARKVSYKNDKSLSAYWASMDVDGNGRLNNADYLNIKKYNTNKVTINQQTVKVITF